MTVVRTKPLGTLAAAGAAVAAGPVVGVWISTMPAELGSVGRIVEVAATGPPVVIVTKMMLGAAPAPAAGVGWTAPPEKKGVWTTTVPTVSVPVGWSVIVVGAAPVKPCWIVVKSLAAVEGGPAAVGKGVWTTTMPEPPPEGCTVTVVGAVPVKPTVVVRRMLTWAVGV